MSLNVKLGTGHYNYGEGGGGSYKTIGDKSSFTLKKKRGGGGGHNKL